MAAKLNLNTYQVSFYTPEQLLLPKNERGYPKHERTRSSTAPRAIAAVINPLCDERNELGGPDKTTPGQFAVLEVKVVAG